MLPWDFFPGPIGPDRGFRRGRRKSDPAPRSPRNSPGPIPANSPPSGGIPLSIFPLDNHNSVFSGTSIGKNSIFEKWRFLRIFPGAGCDRHGLDAYLDPGLSIPRHPAPPMQVGRARCREAVPWQSLSGPNTPPPSPPRDGKVAYTLRGGKGGGQAPGGFAYLSTTSKAPRAGTTGGFTHPSPRSPELPPPYFAGWN